MHFCENLRGSRVPPLTTLLHWETVSSFLARTQTSERIWLPIYDNLNEGEWMDFYNHQVFNYTLPWQRNEPNGGTSENCAMARPSQDERWFDAGCSRGDAFCLCDRDLNFHLDLRGLCASSVIDKYFRPKNNLSDFASLLLVGWKKSKIEYNEVKQNWELSSAGSNVSGVSDAAHHTFSLGKHEWVIIDDSGCRAKGEGKRFL